jgi:hypothetical protein
MEGSTAPEDSFSHSFLKCDRSVVSKPLKVSLSPSEMLMRLTAFKILLEEATKWFAILANSSLSAADQPPPEESRAAVTFEDEAADLSFVVNTAACSVPNSGGHVASLHRQLSLCDNCKSGRPEAAMPDDEDEGLSDKVPKGTFSKVPHSLQLRVSRPDNDHP